MDRTEQINNVLCEYFKTHSEKVAAKDLMPLFVKEKIFKKDYKQGLPVRNLLRKLDENNELDKIPYVLAERKDQNTNWYFQPVKIK